MDMMFCCTENSGQRDTVPPDLVGQARAFGRGHSPTEVLNHDGQAGLPTHPG